MAKGVVYGSAGAGAGYVALTLVWSVLGMIMNPDAFLAYGVAALALVTVAGLRKDLVISMATEATDEACLTVEKSLQTLGAIHARQIPTQIGSIASSSRDTLLRAIARNAISSPPRPMRCAPHNAAE